MNYGEEYNPIYCDICNGLISIGLRFYGEKICKKVSRKLQKKIGGLEKSRTFALPFEKRVAEEAESSYKDWRRNKKIENFC